MTISDLKAAVALRVTIRSTIGTSILAPNLGRSGVARAAAQLQLTDSGSTANDRPVPSHEPRKPTHMENTVDADGLIVVVKPL